MPQLVKFTERYKRYLIATCVCFAVLLAVQFFIYKKQLQEKTDLIQLAHSNMERSNESIREETLSTIYYFQDRMKRPELHEKGQIWYPRIQAVQKTIYSAQGCIAEVFLQNQTPMQPRIQLLDSLRLAYRKLIVIIPDSMRKRMKELPLARLIKDSAQNHTSLWNGSDMLQTDSADWKFVLVNLYNDLLSSGHIVIKYCDDQVHAFTESFEKFEMLFSQNTTALLPGQILEIKAGVGAFTTVTNAKFFIEGKEIEMTDIGYINYKKRVSKNDPGEINVAVEFKFQGGKTQRRESTISYKVLKP